MTPSAERRSDVLSEGSPTRLINMLWFGGILLATVAFWKLRIIDSATIVRGILWTGDLYEAHYPMMQWGFGRLFSGDFPHWNPHQLAGLPFQAITYVGLLYPGNLIYGVVGTGAATELSCIAHLFFAGAGTFALCRAIDFSRNASLMAAFTFMWSGWMMFNINQPSLVSGMSWLPVTILMVELALRGRRWAAFGLILAVTLQVLNGATEVFVQNMYMAGGYTLLRLGELALMGEWRVAFRRGLLLLGCVVCGVLLSTPQLLPSIELAGESSRGETQLSLYQVRSLLGVVRPDRFILSALTASGMVTVGVLPLAGMFLGMKIRRPGLWGFALVCVILSAFLVFGGEVFEIYYETPFGAVFRRPNKFLHIYSFGQALLAGIAVLALEAWSSEPRRIILRHPLFALCVVVLGGSAIYLVWTGQVPIPLLLLVAGMLFFVSVSSARLRSGIIVALLLLQMTTLFFGVKQVFVRPASNFEVFHVFDRTFEAIARRSKQLGQKQRVYLTRAFLWTPGLMQKSGMLHDFYVLGDYEPFASTRIKDFFAAVTPSKNPTHAMFAGGMNLRPGSDWDLLDLTSTRFYVVVPDSKVDTYLDEQVKRRTGKGVALLRTPDHTRIYERPTALPRAYFVPRARLVQDADAALEALRAEGFDPRREVVLEGAPASMADYGGGSVKDVDVVIVEDGPEKVIVTVLTAAPGFLVVTDSYHTDWKAHSSHGELPMYRANYLFRAVPVSAGDTRIEMVYQPRAFHTGLAISGVTALALSAIALYFWRQNPKIRAGSRAL